MRKKFFMIVAMMFLTLSLSGCTSYVKDSKGSPVKEPTTGQTLTSNILCRPTNKDVIKTYKSNKVKLDKLPECSKFTPASGSYGGIWETIFIKPLSYFIIQIGKILGNYGWAIIAVTLLIRLIIFPLSKKSALMSENMKFAQKDLEKLEKKYRGRESQEDQMMKAQEMMTIYKKYDINPMSGCLFAFIQMPLFFAFLESLNRLPIVFEGRFLGYKLGTSPFVALFGSNFDVGKLISSFSNGNFIYLILPIMVALTTFLSFKLNSGVSSGSDEQQSQMKTMMNVMLVFIVFTSFTMPVSIILYWVTGSLFTIVQAEIIRRMKENGSNKVRIKK
ncbi:MAG: YidC/Oxa1 family membrane protein insertase [Bacilli bacterium]|nr:YidC/Oxa1 family membrane protein insertase [Bacilli bacterium]